MEEGQRLWFLQTWVLLLGVHARYQHGKGGGKGLFSCWYDLFRPLKRSLEGEKREEVSKEFPFLSSFPPSHGGGRIIGL